MVSEIGFDSPKAVAFARLISSACWIRTHEAVARASQLERFAPIAVRVLESQIKAGCLFQDPK